VLLDEVDKYQTMKTYNVQAIDGIVPDDLRWRVWEYIQNQTFHATRKNVKYPDVGHIINYRPIDNKKQYMDDSIPSVNNQYMHRTIFGDNETDLAKDHPLVLELWECINKHFNDEFIIDGDPEGIADHPPRLARVYVNAQPSETIKRSHGVHRDTIELDKENYFTLLYIANLQWYPTWMSEIIFYSDDETTGDTQQFQKGYGQSRNFDVGYPYAMVAPKEGRVILYDGRAMHTTKPTAPWAEHMRYAVVFRIRKKI
jgi:hypothetical protein